MGFALETNNERAYALEKLQTKNLDAIVLNSLRDEGAGFGVDTNKVTILGSDGTEKALGLKSKKAVAADIVSFIIEKHA
jgi:phosphopantothenoylcysteine decarboxylase/phosphopantothenate--cysteine ligase